MNRKPKPKYYECPIHPETGKPWGEKYWELLGIATEIRYGPIEDRDFWMNHWKKAREGVKFQMIPEW